MAHAVLSFTSKKTMLFEWNDNTFETFHYVWVDASKNSGENIITQKKLRSLIDHLQTFEELHKCIKYIQSIPSQDRLVLIISGDLSQQLIPQIHHMQQVYSIYIYSIDKEFYQQWAQQYTKVKGVYNQLDQLMARMKCYQMKRIRHPFDEPLSMSIFYSNTIDGERTTSGLDGRFVHSQLLIDCLLRMQPSPTDKDEFISQCRQDQAEDIKSLEFIDEFEKTYSSDSSVKWYTKPSFLSRMLNRSLRFENIDLLFGLRFFIRDIERHLQRYRFLARINIYRGQLISTEELDIFKQSKNRLISTNSFFSTNRNRRIALFLLGASNTDKNVQRVLFEIDADPCREGVKPFADITSLSQLAEEEVLMMLGSVFRLNDIYLDQEDIWIIRMTLCSDNDHDLKSVFDHMKNQYGAEETRLLLFGHVLVDMGRFDDAEKYYYRLLLELPSGHRDISKCYHALGKVAYEKGNYDFSLQLLHKSLGMVEEQLINGHSRVGFIHTSIGEVYQKKGENERALKSYTKALEIWKEAFGDDHEYIAWCYNNLGIIYDAKKDYSKALAYHKKALAIKKKLPTLHPCLGNTYINIGNVYYHLGQYDQALENYECSYKIYANSLTPQHPSIACALKNIGAIYEVEENFFEALQNYRKVLFIRQKMFRSSHPDVVEIEQDIERVLTKQNKVLLLFDRHGIKRILEQKQ